MRILSLFVAGNLLALSSGWEDATLTDVVAIVTVELVTALAFFFAGAMAGSFTNVIVYRLPRRENVLWPPSRCPACGRRISIRDNLPVLGWLLLRGRCRWCKATIPAGYLGVEVLVGVLFLGLLYLEIHTGGSNLPLRTPNHYGGALWTIWYPREDLLTLYAYHCMLALFLTCLALLAWQGDRLPGGLVAVALLVGTLVPVWAPGVQQVPWTGAPGQDRSIRPRPYEGVESAVIGLAAGVVLGAVLAMRGPARTTRSTGTAPRWPLPSRFDLAVVFGVAGAWLGWQAVVSVGVLTALAVVFCPPRLPPTVLAAAAVAVQLTVWRLLTVYVPWWPGPHTSMVFMAGWAILAVVLPLVCSVRSGPPGSPEAVPGEERSGAAIPE